VTAAPSATLLDLLGDTRAQVVELLRAEPATATELAEQLGLSAVAVRRHLQVLERDGLVDAETVRRDGPGRPSARYALTARARQLFPDRSAEIANELLEFLEASYGRPALTAFLRWRQERHGQRYAAHLAGAVDGMSRTELLARLLSEDGFAAQVRELDPAEAPPGVTVLELRQSHCAVADVAEEHPELCAFEAALFKQVLGAQVSRKSTIAAGAGACVCHVTLPDQPTPQMRSTHGHQS
jgi:predicted ArsR family transcriptional regulator